MTGDAEDLPVPFATESDRRRLTGTAIKAVSRIVDAWGCSDDEGAALIGLAADTWQQMKAGEWIGVLDQDQLIRASALIGVYEALHNLFADDMANRWPRLINAGGTFKRASPIEMMIGGKADQVFAIREHLEALMQGL